MLVYFGFTFCPDVCPVELQKMGRAISRLGTSNTSVCTVAGGIAIGGAQLFMKLSFAADPEAMGPLASVVCADVILVSLLCHFFYNERLTPGQWGSVGLVFAGLVTMAGPFGGGGGGVSLTGFGFAVCAPLPSPCRGTRAARA